MDRRHRISVPPEPPVSLLNALSSLVRVPATSTVGAISVQSPEIIPLAPGQAFPTRGVSRLGCYLQITRPRIVATVMMTAATGYLLATPEFSLAGFVTFLVGLTLISGAANAFNQILEKHLDAQMIRTRRRPLASGQLSSKNALIFASAICAMGLGILYVIGMLTMLLGLLALVSYDLLYTPLKRVTPLSLYVGAIPGALPPLIGTAAVTNHISASGLVLFAILFFWQMPHFVAIGWLYREDYARAGFHILSVRDEEGSTSAWTGLICSVALLPVLWLAAHLHTLGVVWLFISGALALGFIFYAAQFFRFRNVATARRLFIASNIFLTITMLAASMGAISRLIQSQ